MKQGIIIDTGPLVAFLSKHDTYHQWSVRQLGNVAYPLLTCEAVITEACFLLHRATGREEVLLDMLHDQLITIPYKLSERLPSVRVLMKRYRNIPMSLADACLVDMAERQETGTIMTLDSDFNVYRMRKNKVIPVIAP